jgi:cation diffusion facilitator CzcD-associated flavoprotein CzcO
MRARHVAVALGFAHFPHIPVELLSLLPERSCAHTSRLVDFSTVNGERILIVGGRQSAFEWAALMNEAGAASVDVVHRHATPDFSPSEWAWVGPLVRRMRTDPGWYRRLEDDERRALDCRFWSEGRLKLEPWLAPRLAAPGVHLRPGCTIVGCHERSDGRLDIALSDGTVARVDRVVFATGYKVDLERVPLLRHLTATGALRTRNGFPELDDHFQTSIPNLYVTSMPATQDFGPFLAFTVSACVSAALIGEAITTSPRGAFVQT